MAILILPPFLNIRRIIFLQCISFTYLNHCDNLRFEIKEKENANGVIKPLCKDLELDDMVEIK
jgi:hypothetical protein